MKRNRPYKWRIALGAGVLVTVGSLPQARAQLVYEPQTSANPSMQSRIQNREATREDMESAEKAKDTVQSLQAQEAAPPVTTVTAPVTSMPVTAVPITQPVQAAAPVQAVQPVVAPAQPVAVPVAVQVQPQVQVAEPSQAQDAQDNEEPDVGTYSKAELLRRERTRVELQNEDLLQERLEQLRLDDEERRTKELLGENPGPEQAITPIGGLSEGSDSAAPAANVTAQPQSDVVEAPVTDHPGQSDSVVAPVPTAAQAQQFSSAKSQYNVAAQDQIDTSQAMETSVASDEGSQKTSFTISPRAGVSSMNVNSGFNVSGHFSLGVEGGVSISDNLTFEVGYSYNEYGIGYGDSITSLYGANTQFDAYTLKQNVINADLKLYFLGPDAKLRPFLTGGFGYAIGYLNYPSNILNFYQGMGYQNMAQDYKTNAYLGTLGAGLDVKVNKTISIGAQFQYYTVLSVNENNNLYYGAYGPAGYTGAVVGPGTYAMDPTGKGPAGASLAQSSFYTMTAGLSFAF